jgi:acyl carrier protein
MFTDEATLKRVCDIIAETTGNELEDVQPYAFLDDDLGVTPLDFTRIVKQINKDFGIRLDADELLETEEIETVAHLATVVAEEKELG